MFKWAANYLYTLPKNEKSSVAWRWDHQKIFVNAIRSRMVPRVRDGDVRNKVFLAAHIFLYQLIKWCLVNLRCFCVFSFFPRLTFWLFNDGISLRCFVSCKYQKPSGYKRSVRYSKNKSKNILKSIRFGRNSSASEVLVLSTGTTWTNSWTPLSFGGLLLLGPFGEPTWFSKTSMPEIDCMHTNFVKEYQIWKIFYMVW